MHKVLKVHKGANNLFLCVTFRKVLSGVTFAFALYCYALALNWDAGRLSLSNSSSSSMLYIVRLLSSGQPSGVLGNQQRFVVFFPFNLNTCI